MIEAYVGRVGDGDARCTDQRAFVSDYSLTTSRRLSVIPQH